MKGYLKREDDFTTRRVHIADLSDAELKERFWQLAEEAVAPLLDMAKTHTTPSVERSVLLRMGFSSIEAQPIVNGVMERGLMGKGAGHVVYRIAKEKNISVRQAGLEMIDGKHWDDAVEIFKGGQK
ncbi:D-ornithine 4,5-aminomutase S subunit [Dethiosulfatibacter aminovorans DSM 17477]|uniref:D-ornithine 4,5-aminomutase S subunit n=1 Tax=Dethiosulfatibacter aminovorans DSM 17477 TaxID=1121476 RepID=A0A1M6ICF2_9FIRM|nr:ornithine aminomutase subunit alpha [Dethiosulfatibacter aminovorans]SHJ32128.1 D-ornithine 4,5-aminomutase S subunit [Dethiosulfatibacter aminovorans DSM 17477]